MTDSCFAVDTAPRQMRMFYIQTIWWAHGNWWIFISDMTGTGGLTTWWIAQSYSNLRLVIIIFNNYAHDYAVEQK